MFCTAGVNAVSAVALQYALLAVKQGMFCTAGVNAVSAVALQYALLEVKQQLSFG